MATAIFKLPLTPDRCIRIVFSLVIVDEAHSTERGLRKGVGLVLGCKRDVQYVIGM